MISRQRLRRLLVLVTGWGLIGLGVLGLALPFLQGVLFILVGLLVLSTEYHWARRLFERLRQRFPRVDERVERVRAWWRRTVQRLRGTSAPRSGSPSPEPGTGPPGDRRDDRPGPPDGTG